MEVLKFLKDDLGVKMDRILETQHRQAEAQQRLGNEVLLLRGSVDAEFKVFGHRLAGVEARVGNLERDAENTSDHNLAELQKQLDKQKDTGRDTFWRIITLIFAFAGGSVMQLIISQLLLRR